MAKEKMFFCACAVCALAIGALAHFANLGDIPEGFFIDECSIGYNAYCISRTGADEYGERFPLFFRAFDNYQDPAMVYFLAPLVATFGLEKWVVRFPSGLFHMLAAIVLFFILKKYSASRWISLGGAFVFSVLPWIFPLSRTMFSGYTAMLLGICIGWLYFMKGMESNRRLFLVFSAFGFALAMYSHNCGRPMAAVLLVGLAFSYRKSISRSLRKIYPFATALAVMLLPMCASVAVDSKPLTSRFSTISLWQDSPGILELVERLASRYIGYFSPKFLFFQGDPNLRHNTGGGELYLFMLPLILAGLYFLTRNLRYHPRNLFILFALATYPAAAILTFEPMHATRSMAGAPFFCICSFIGLKMLAGKRFALKKAAACIFAILAFSEICIYFGDYFSSYSTRARLYFNAPFTKLIETAVKEKPEGGKIYVSDSILPFPVDGDYKPYVYSYFCFFGRIEPSDYVKNGIFGSVFEKYSGKCGREGILMASRTRRIFQEGIQEYGIILNREPVPSGAELIGKIKEGKEFPEEEYLLFKVKASLEEKQQQNRPGDSP